MQFVQFVQCPKFAGVCVYGAMLTAIPPDSSLNYVQPFARYIAPVLNATPEALAEYVVGQHFRIDSLRAKKFGNERQVFKSREPPGGWDDPTGGVKRERTSSPGGDISEVFDRQYKKRYIDRVKVKSQSPTVSINDNPFVFPSRRYRRGYKGW